MDAGFAGEYLGTAVLMLLGIGTNANVTLAKSKAQGSDWTTIT